MNAKPLIIVLLIIVVIQMGLNVYLLSYHKKIKAVMLGRSDVISYQKKQLTADSQLKPSDVKSAPVPEVAKPADKSVGAVYENKEYGFQIELPKGWEAYKIKLEKNPDFQGASYLHVMLPIADPGVGEENRVTNEKYPGYTSMFAITIWNKNVWDAHLKECTDKADEGVAEGPGYCPNTDEVAGSNSDYVLTATFGQDYPKDAQLYIPGLKEGFIALATEFLHGRLTMMTGS